MIFLCGLIASDKVTGQYHNSSKYYYWVYFKIFFSADQTTLREFDRMCLSGIEPLEPKQIKEIRESSHVSQAVFAAILNTSLSTVQKWEIGQKRPSGTALKLLHLVKKRGLNSVID